MFLSMSTSVWPTVALSWVGLVSLCLNSCLWIHILCDNYLFVGFWHCAMCTLTEGHHPFYRIRGIEIRQESHIWLRWFSKVLCFHYVMCTFLKTPHVFCRVSGLLRGTTIEWSARIGVFVVREWSSEYHKLWPKEKLWVNTQKIDVVTLIMSDLEKTFTHLWGAGLWRQTMTHISSGNICWSCCSKQIRRAWVFSGANSTLHADSTTRVAVALSSGKTTQVSTLRNRATKHAQNKVPHPLVDGNYTSGTFVNTSGCPVAYCFWRVNITYLSHMQSPSPIYTELKATDNSLCENML